MKSHEGKHTIITSPEIEKYAELHTSEESEEIKELVQSSDEELEYIDMISGKLVGQLLKMLIRVSGAERVLEIGTFTGYSSMMMAEALPEHGEVITLEMNIRYQNLAQKHFDDSATGHKITMIKGNAQQTLPELEGKFDLAYLDGDKLWYEFYYNQVLPKLRSGGLIVADNVLWDGTVLDPRDSKARAIAAFNKLIAEDDRVEQVVVPVRDGVSIIRKI